MYICVNKVDGKTLFLPADVPSTAGGRQVVGGRMTCCPSGADRLTAGGLRNVPLQTNFLQDFPFVFCEKRKAAKCLCRRKSDAHPTEFGWGEYGGEYAVQYQPQAGEGPVLAADVHGR